MIWDEVFSSTKKGMVPPTLGVTGFLKTDGTWATPSGTGVEIQNAGSPVADGPFTTLNFAPNTTVSNVSMASAGGGVVNLTIGLNLNTSNTWTVDQVVPAEAYGSGWNGSNEIPTKNDVYDQMELKAAKVGLKFYIKDAQATPHYWQLTVTTLGVLTTADAGTTLPTDGIVIYP